MPRVATNRTGDGPDDSQNAFMPNPNQNRPQPQMQNPILQKFRAQMQPGMLPQRMPQQPMMPQIPQAPQAQPQQQNRFQALLGLLARQGKNPNV